MTDLATARVFLDGDSIGLTQTLNRAAKDFERAGAKMSSAGRRLTRNVTLPLAAIGAGSVKAFSEFDSAMTQSVAIMGDVSSAMRGEMAAAARQVSRDLTVTSTQAAESFFFLASAGLDAEQSIAALPQVAAFAQAGMFDMSRATDLATDAQSALGLAADDATVNLRNMTRVTDVLVRANTLANASVEQFSTALTTEAGAAMKTFGIDVEEGVAVLAAFADQGIKGQVAGSGFSRILRLMSQAAVNNKEEMAELGISFFDAEGNMRNMADVVENLTTVLGPMSDEQRAASLEAIGFTARVQGIIQPLLGTSAAIREYEAGLRAAGGTTRDVASKQLVSFSAQMQIARNRIVNAAQTLGRILAPTVLSITQRIADAADSFANLSPRVQTMIVAAAGAAAALGPLLIVAGSLAAALGALLSPVGLVVAGIGSIAAVALAGAADLGGFQEKIVTGFRIVRDVVLDAASFVVDALDAIIQAVRPTANFLIALFVGTGNAAIAVWGAIRDDFIAAFTAIREFVRPIIVGIATGLEFIGQLAAGAAEKIRNALTGGTEGGAEGGGLGAEIQAGFRDAFETDFVGAIGEQVTAIKEKLQAAAAAAVSFAGALGGGGGEGGGEGGGPTLAGAVREGRNLFIDYGTVLDNLKTQFDAAKQKAEEQISTMERLNAVAEEGSSAFGKLGGALGALSKIPGLGFLGDVGGKLGGFGGILGGLAGLVPGLGSIGSLFGGFFAHGGTIPAGKVGVVGEAGPELVSGPATVTPSGNVRVTLMTSDGRIIADTVTREQDYSGALDRVVTLPVVAMAAGG